MNLTSTNLKRMVEREEQHMQENERLRQFILQQEKARAQSVEAEVETRLRTTTENHETELNALRGALSASEEHSRGLADAANADAEARWISTTNDLRSQVNELQAQLATRNDCETAHVVQLEKDISAVQLERDTLRRKLGLTHRNLAQAHDDHQKVAVLEGTVTRQYDEIVGLSNGLLQLKDRKLKKTQD
ncbi:uncharacterized protein KD926_010189 [Aspergillus affinis]|uniref:uncharacterized protein n=1 Tax=Aspergillus affinis TaxID=1070780 RepID=UPI0022FE0A1B|nr:uncharacterized protein KD926_010189 [Aspergillus affinis]KAI9038856.1 hypothetical protein KD926_010189 [Aspergillus affinis]